MIPAPKAAVPGSGNQSDSGNSSGGAGAVSGTDSESEVDMKGKEVLDVNDLKWTPRLETTLEEMLLRNVFDFGATAKEFQRYLNSKKCSDVSPSQVAIIDQKKL